MRFAIGIAILAAGGVNLCSQWVGLGIWQSMEFWEMSISAHRRQRLKEVAQKLVKLIEDEKQERGREFTFAELEDDSIEITDLLAQMLVEERLAQKFSAAEPSVCCPTCQHDIARDADEPRVLQTDRGEVTWTEPTYACPTCRRAFFPDELRIGDSR